jgi:5-carboxymethyl-2-hydroxymuconate isomerase
MPHTIIEHSFKISAQTIDSLLLQFNKKIASSEGNFDISQCKARSVSLSNFVVAEGSASQDFMHITVKIMEGRSIEIRRNLAINLLEMTSDFLKQHNLSPNQIALSLDVVEIEKEVYQKTVFNPSL